jgi:hypothetical protein
MGRPVRGFNDCSSTTSGEGLGEGSTVTLTDGEGETDSTTGVSSSPPAPQADRNSNPAPRTATSFRFIQTSHSSQKHTKTFQYLKNILFRLFCQARAGKMQRNQVSHFA